MPEDRSREPERETRGVDGPSHAVEVTVRYAATDQMGCAHHGVYVVWCELGRTSMMRERGVSYSEMERNGVLLPVTRLEVEYRAAAHYEETVRIETRVEAARSRSVRFAYEIIGPGERLLARARTDLACVDGEGRTRRIPQEVLERSAGSRAMSARVSIASRRGSDREPRVSRGAGRCSLAAALILAAIAGCSKQVQTGPPLADPEIVAARVHEVTGPPGPFRLRFDWQYADEHGQLSGEGVARYNPTDSLRLDLFAPGDASMGVSLTPSGLTTLGQIEEVRLPGPVFLYAMAGIFRPGGTPPGRGFLADSSQVLVFPVGNDSLFAHVQGSRVVRLEERRSGRVRKRIEVSWDGLGVWPRSAEYRDFVESRRVRWELTEATEVLTKHAAEIYDLPHRM